MKFVCSVGEIVHTMLMLFDRIFAVFRIRMSSLCLGRQNVKLTNVSLVLIVQFVGEMLCDGYCNGIWETLNCAGVFVVRN